MNAFSSAPLRRVLFGDLKDKRKTINLGDPVACAGVEEARANVGAGAENLFPAGAVYERTVLKLFRKKDK